MMWHRCQVTAVAPNGFLSWLLHKVPTCPIYRSSLSTSAGCRCTGFASGKKAALMSSPWSDSAAYRLVDGRTFLVLGVCDCCHWAVETNGAGLHLWYCRSLDCFIVSSPTRITFFIGSNYLLHILNTSFTLFHCKWAEHRPEVQAFIRPLQSELL